MSILELPIPPKPDYFGPDGAPPGVDLELDAYGPWVATRPVITPSTIVTHTNAAQREGTVQASINWGNSASNRTKPHYCVNWPRPAKTLATDRRSIANSTGRDIEQLYGVQDSSFWSISIETADSGTLADPAISDFLTTSVHGAVEVPHAEIVARIHAYESIVWDIPLAVPDTFPEPGVVAHTWPFPYPHFTTVPGKTCPGPKKIAALRNEVWPRAVLIRAAWLGETPPEELMKHVKAAPFVMRMEGCAAVVYFDGANARPITQTEAWSSEALLEAVAHVIDHPMPYHIETARWLVAQGIDLART